MKKERVAALDIVRSLAIFFVITLHSVSLTGVLSGNINSIGWTVNLYIRHLTFCCVPLFIILSGYLQCKKKLSLSYYKGIIPIAVSYIIISILCRQIFEIKIDAGKALGLYVLQDGGNP